MGVGEGVLVGKGEGVNVGAGVLVGTGVAVGCGVEVGSSVGAGAGASAEVTGVASGGAADGRPHAAIKGKRQKDIGNSRRIRFGRAPNLVARRAKGLLTIAQRSARTGCAQNQRFGSKQLASRGLDSGQRHAFELLHD